MELTIEEIHEESEIHSGYCKKCDELTHDCCEPDAREYECPACGDNAVYGIEESVLVGLIQIKGD